MIDGYDSRQCPEEVRQDHVIYAVKAGYCYILRNESASGTRATQPTLPAGPTSTTIVLYVDSVKKEHDYE